jgi:hypothetical protein
LSRIIAINMLLAQSASGLNPMLDPVLILVIGQVTEPRGSETCSIACDTAF